MKRFVLAWAVSLLAMGAIRAETPTPSVVVSVNTLAATAAPAEGFTRLRLNLTHNESKSQSIPLASAAVCSASVCYEAAVPSSILVSNTSKGLSTAIADFEIPFTEIVSIRFQARGRKTALEGSVALPAPLKLDPDFKGGDVLVVVEKNRDAYRPTAAAANYYQPAGTALYYSPAIATTALLPHGVTLSIPAGALAAPQVFIVAVHDTGEDHPLIDIYPGLSLAKTARLVVPALVRSVSSVGTDLSSQSPIPPTPRPKAASPAGASSLLAPAAGSDAALTVEINATGTVRPGVSRPGSVLNDASTTARVTIGKDSVSLLATCNQAGWCNCANQLAFPDNQLIIAQALAATGTASFNWCSTIEPYVHIAIAHLGDARERFTIKHSAKVDRNGYKYLPLQPLATWARNTQVMINGFTWEGDQGTGTNQFGLANGYVAGYKPAEILGVNRVGGASCEDLTSYTNCLVASMAAGNKRVMNVPQKGIGVSWFDKDTMVVFGGVTSYVSSSTSVVKNGVCSTDTLSSRWSAVGTTSAGRMIFISSTSDGTTTAAALCPVFQALGASNAIRLDGGPSAAIAIDGLLMNPLRGLYFAKYGAARYIPYGLKMSYEGW